MKRTIEQQKSRNPVGTPLLLQRGAIFIAVIAFFIALAHQAEAVGVKFFFDASYGGAASQELGLGTYTTAQLEVLGVGNNTASSCKIPDGWVITIYDNDGLSGQLIQLARDTASFLNFPGLNDAMSSCKIESGTLPGPAFQKVTRGAQPFFPIALYNYAVAGGARSQDISSLKEMAAAGVNTLLQHDHSSAWENTPAITLNTLNRLQDYKIALIDQIWTYNVTLDNWIGMTEFHVNGSLLDQQINLLKGHPNLLGWETFDEAFGYGTPPGLTALESGHDFLKTKDNSHLIFCNQNPISTRNEAMERRPWINIGDTLANDWYPYDTVYTPNYPLYAVHDAQDFNVLAADNDAAAPFVTAMPVYMVLQGFPIGSVTPTFAGERYMTYSTIIHGASAVFWWGTYHLKPTDQLWKDILRCAGELRDLQDVFEEGTVLGVTRNDKVAGTYTSSSVSVSDHRLEAIACSHGVNRYVIVANTSPSASVTASVTVSGWNYARNGNNTIVLFETDGSGNQRASIPTTSTSWTDTFAPYGVHVYTDRQFTQVAMDFDGDGTADTAVYDPAGEVRIARSSNGQTIYVKTGSTTEVKVADVDLDGKFDLGVKSGAKYSVKLSTLNYQGTRSLTTLTGTVLPVLPAVPTGLTATAGDGQVAVSWSAVSGASSYNVYRSTAGGYEGLTHYKTGITSTSDTDLNVVNGTTYFYTVAAVNAVGVSSQSSEVSATPGAGGAPVMINNNDPGIAYSSGRYSWANSSNRGFGDYMDDVKYTTDNGASFTVTFSGTGIDYITEKNFDQGNVDIYVDGILQTTVNCYNASRLVQQTVYSKTGLAPGTHTLKGVKKDGAYALVDAFKVYP